MKLKPLRRHRCAASLNWIYKLVRIRISKRCVLATGKTGGVGGGQPLGRFSTETAKWTIQLKFKMFTVSDETKAELCHLYLLSLPKPFCMRRCTQLALGLMGLKATENLRTVGCTNVLGNKWFWFICTCWNSVRSTVPCLLYKTTFKEQP